MKPPPSLPIDISLKGSASASDWIARLGILAAEIEARDAKVSDSLRKCAADAFWYLGFCEYEGWLSAAAPAESYGGLLADKSPELYGRLRRLLAQAESTLGKQLFARVSNSKPISV